MNNESPLDMQIYAGKGQSASIFAHYLFEIIEQNPRLRIVSSDMFASASLSAFKHLYPEHCINVGIAEQNLIGVASGLASEGFKCVAVAQGAFITMRSFEQVRQYLSYMQNNVILVGLNAGFMLQYYGNTHYALEDIALMRSIPGMVVLCPADAGEAVKSFEEALKLDAPVYIRLTGGVSIPTVYESDFPFKIGQPNVVKEGNDIAIFATGTMVYYSLKAAGILQEKGVSAKVVDVHTLKPFDTTLLKESKNYRLLVSVEEHSILGGLGTVLAEYLSEKRCSPPLLRLGVKDTYSVPGGFDFLLSQHRLTPECIAEDILEKLKTPEL